MEIEGAKREELTEILRIKLIESGWRDELTSKCRESIHKHGLETVRLEQIIEDVSAKAKESVPDHVKQEMLNLIRCPQNEQQHQQQQLTGQPQPSTSKHS